MTRLPIFKLVLATLVLGAIQSVVLLQVNWFGEAASTATGPIDTLMDVTIVVSCFIFALVCVFLGYAVFKWRVKPGDEGDGLPVHGNTRLEVWWTLIPILIVVGLAGYSWAVLVDIEKKDADRINVDVYSQQFAWSFAYPDSGGKFSEGELHVPVNRQLDLKFHAQDVIHSFWVPEWRVKKDTVPGITTDLVVTPDKEGTYQLVCAELCGIGHTTMRAKVVVESEEKYNQWVSQLKEKVPPFLLTAEQAIDAQRKAEEREKGIEGSGVEETGSADHSD